MALGVDYTPYHFSWDGTTVQIEQVSATRGLGQPALLAAPGRLDIFVRGFDRAVHHVRKTGAGVVEERVGGVASDFPTAAATVAGAGTIRRVFVHGQDNRIWAASSLDDGPWTWELLAPAGMTDRFAGSPTASIDGDTVVVHVRTSAGALGVFRRTPATGWTYANVGGTISGFTDLARRRLVRARSRRHAPALRRDELALGGWPLRLSGASTRRCSGGADAEVEPVGAGRLELPTSCLLRRRPPNRVLIIAVSWACPNCTVRLEEDPCRERPVDPNRFAQDLFRPLPRRYDLLEELLSLGQNGALEARDGRARRASGRSERHSRRRHRDRRRRARTDAASPAPTSPESTSPRRCCATDTSGSRASAPRTAYGSSSGKPNGFPFPTTRSTRSTFTYLLRYVADPAATLRELARVPQARARAIASLEFSVPPNRFWRFWWWLYTRGVLPVAGYLTGGRDMESGRTLPRTQHLRALRPLLRALDHPSVAGGRDCGRRRSLDEPGRRARDVGSEAGR